MCSSHFSISKAFQPHLISSSTSQRTNHYIQSDDPPTTLSSVRSRLRSESGVTEIALSVE